ncbi:MAG: MFS transporter [Dehalococcoidia bacterium]
MLKFRNALISIRELGTERLRLLGVVTGGHFAIHWFQQLFPVVLPSVKAGLGLSDVQIGALASARQMTQGTLNLPSGILADSLVRYRAVIMTSALVFMGVAYLLLGLAPAFVWALLGAGLVGLGSAVWHPAAVASLSNRFPERRATALSVHGMGATLSDTVTPLVVGALLLTFPWQAVLKLQIVPALLMGLLVWLGLLGFFAGVGSQSSSSTQIREIGKLVRNPVFLGVSAARGLMQMGRLVILTFLPIYLQEHLGYSSFVLGFYITLLHGMGTVSQPVLGFLSDRFGRKVVLLPSFLTLGLLYLLLGVAAPGIQLGLVITAIGLFFYTLMNIANVAVMDVAGSKIQASSYGLTSLVTQILVLPTPIVAGFLIGVYGIGSAFLLAGGLVLLAGLVVAPLRLYRGLEARRPGG